jgi:hypothetical protein
MEVLEKGGNRSEEIRGDPWLTIGSSTADHSPPELTNQDFCMDFRLDQTETNSV